MIGTVLSLSPRVFFRSDWRLSAQTSDELFRFYEELVENRPFEMGKSFLKQILIAALNNPPTGKTSLDVLGQKNKFAAIFPEFSEMLGKASQAESFFDSLCENELFYGFQPWPGITAKDIRNGAFPDDISILPLQKLKKFHASLAQTDLPEILNSAEKLDSAWKPYQHARARFFQRLPSRLACIPSIPLIPEDKKGPWVAWATASETRTFLQTLATPLDQKKLSNFWAEFDDTLDPDGKIQKKIQKLRNEIEQALRTWQFIHFSTENDLKIDECGGNQNALTVWFIKELIQRTLPSLEKTALKPRMSEFLHDVFAASETLGGKTKKRDYHEGILSWGSVNASEYAISNGVLAHLEWKETLPPESRVISISSSRVAKNNEGVILLQEFLLAAHVAELLASPTVSMPANQAVEGIATHIMQVFTPVEMEAHSEWLKNRLTLWPRSARPFIWEKLPLSDAVWQEKMLVSWAVIPQPWDDVTTFREKNASNGVSLLTWNDLPRIASEAQSIILRNASLPLSENWNRLLAIALWEDILWSILENCDTQQWTTPGNSAFMLSFLQTIHPEIIRAKLNSKAHLDCFISDPAFLDIPVFEKGRGKTPRELVDLLFMEWCLLGSKLQDFPDLNNIPNGKALGKLLHIGIWGRDAKWTEELPKHPEWENRLKRFSRHANPTSGEKKE
jgi:hypothetical protein